MMLSLEQVKRKDLGLVLIYIFSFLGLVIAFTIIGIILSTMSVSDSTIDTITVIFYVLFYGGLAIGMVWYERNYVIQHQWAIVKRKPAFTLLMVLLGLFLIFTVLYLIAGFYTLIGYEATSQNQEAIESMMSQWYNIIMVGIFSVIFVPFVEELVFRKAIYGIFYRKWGNVAAILLNSFIFAAIHMTSEITNFAGYLPYFLMGTVISFAYFYSGKLIMVPILIHMFWNLFSLLMNL